MQARLIRSAYLLAILCLISSRGYAEAPDFRDEIAPLLNKYCVGCHNDDDAEGKLSFESFASLQKGGRSGPALMPGDSSSSRLIRVLTGAAEPAMPPEDEPVPTKDEVAALVAWINSGANGPEGVSPSVRQLVTPKLAPSKAAKPITSVAFSPDGQMLAVARFGHVELRTADGQRPIGQLAEHPGKVNAVSFSSDGAWLLTATGITGLYGQAMAWDVTSGQLLKTFEGHRDYTLCGGPQPGRPASGYGQLRSSDHCLGCRVRPAVTNAGGAQRRRLRPGFLTRRPTVGHCQRRRDGQNLAR